MAQCQPVACDCARLLLDGSAWRWDLKQVALIFGVILLCACEPEIGDDCVADSDCGSGQVCDGASRGGYCTISPCEEDDCPGGSSCIVFENELSYCMKRCSNNGDCRKGYTCDKTYADHGFCRQKK